MKLTERLKMFQEGVDLSNSLKNFQLGDAIFMLDDGKMKGKDSNNSVFWFIFS